jgi:AraC-like DNA-binding protein
VLDVPSDEGKWQNTPPSVAVDESDLVRNVWGEDDLDGISDESKSDITEWDRYSPEAVRNTLRRIEKYGGESAEVMRWKTALRQLQETYWAGDAPGPKQFREAELARQTVQRRQRGVRPLAEWKRERRNGPRRKSILELFDLGLNAAEIAPRVELSKSQVRKILQQSGKDAFEEWKASTRNEPRRARCVELRKAGANITDIGRDVGLSRTRVRAILKEEGVYE